MAVPYTFGSATAAIPLSQLDSNFATTITLGNTAVQLGNTITNLTGVSNLASASALSLGSNGNTTAVTIDTSQNVGIGTSSPAVKLDVTGQGRATTGFAVSTDGSTFTPSGLNAIPNYGVGYITSTSQTVLSGFGGIPFYTNQAERARIDSNGNVGIGTAANNVYDQAGAPRPLVVQSSSSSTTVAGSTNAITICNSDTTTSNSSQLNFAAITGASTNQYSSAVISCIYGARTNGQYSTGQLVFSTSSATNSAPTEKARIDSSGNVGIGTSSPSALLTLAAGTATANTGPLKFTSGTNLTTPETGAVEYDGTVMTATSNTNFKRGTVPLTNYASGTGTALGTNTEATDAVLLPAANDTITLSIGTYFLDMSFIITRGATSTTSATARLNIRGTGGAVGTFSGMSLSAPTAGGATANFAFDAVNITTDNVLTAASTTAAGVYTMTVRGLLKVTTAGTIIPQYSLSANINAAGTVSKVLYLRLQQVDSQSAAAAGPAGTGWA